MRLVTFRTAEGMEGIGAIHSDGFIVDFSGLGPQFPGTMQLLIEAGEDALAQARRWTDRADAEARRSMEDVRILAPIPRPIRLRDGCLFLNHMEASYKKLDMELPDEFRQQPVYVNSDTAHVFGTGDDIPWPMDSNWIDYELEWACVIGKPGYAIDAENARDHIFGYTIFNDWSARDTQKEYMKIGAGPGPAKDFANTLGPCIATVDEFEDPYALEMKAFVNNEQWSSGVTGTMYHTFESALAHFSRVAPLVVGEILGSGTVLTGCGLEQDRPLSVGDVVRLEIEGIGSISNRVIRL